MNYWLMKSEPQECSVDDALAAPNATVPWTGVRNYQARNFMRDQMRVGDGVLFYHSSCAEPGIVGIARVASGTRPDPTQSTTIVVGTLLPNPPSERIASEMMKPAWSFTSRNPRVPLTSSSIPGIRIAFRP